MICNLWRLADLARIKIRCSCPSSKVIPSGPELFTPRKQTLHSERRLDPVCTPATPTPHEADRSREGCPRSPLLAGIARRAAVWHVESFLFLQPVHISHTRSGEQSAHGMPVGVWVFPVSRFSNAAKVPIPCRSIITCCSAFRCSSLEEADNQPGPARQCCLLQLDRRKALDQTREWILRPCSRSLALVSKDVADWSLRY